MKIAIGMFGEETNSFATGLFRTSMLDPDRWTDEKDLLSRFGGTQSYLGGMIRAAGEENDVELVPLPSLNIFAGQTLAQEFTDGVLDRICRCLARSAKELDGICFALHGAGCAEDTDDLQVYTVKALRSVVGNELPITASADLHGNISPELMDLLQGLYGIKENPHTDCEAAGYLAMRCLIRELHGEIRQRSAVVQLPLLITPAASSTFSYPMKYVKEFFAAYCKAHGLLDATFFHGFSAADFPGSRASVVIMADGTDPKEHARFLADYVWRLRGELVPESLTPDQAIDRALEKRKDGYVVINEISDNVGSGCPGDGTHLLRALLKRNLPRTMFNVIRDGEVAEQAHKAGVGARIDIRLGGKTEPLAGEPIELKGVEVLALAEGSYPYRSPNSKGLYCKLGKVARLRSGNVEFIVISALIQTLDDGALLMTGTSTDRYDIICLKSANHFRSFFEPIADAVVTADPPGLRAGNLKTYPYRRLTRPIYPLDPDTVWDPSV